MWDCTVPFLEDCMLADIRCREGGDIQESGSESLLSKQDQDLGSLPKRQDPDPLTGIDEKDVIGTSEYI